MKLSEFLPLHAIRAPNMAWLLGAGASAAAGIPTAYNMIWDFKRTVFCAAHRISVQLLQDLGDPDVQTRIQTYLDATGLHPHMDAADEYAHYFEFVYPSEADRRRYIDQKVAGASPSIGHRALAAMLAGGKIRLIWTTNFDRLPEDAATTALGGSSRVTVATLDNSTIAIDALNEGRWPLIGKLHGDFQSRRLKNTSDELRAQDALMRRALVESCRRFGLAIVGYSGRDDSVMDSLEEAIADGIGFPHGLYWFQRTGSPCFSRVQKLLDMARGHAIEAQLVESETFDELFTDLTILHGDLPVELSSDFRRVVRVSDAPVPAPGDGWPVIRTNAVPITSIPAVCRRIECEIGGTSEVTAVIEATCANIIAVRTRVGVLAFGPDEEARKAFGARGITEFDLHAIEPNRLSYESGEFGLLLQGLGRAIGRERPVLIDRRGRSYFARPRPDALAGAEFARLRRLTGAISGVLPVCKLSWSEAVRFRLDYRLNRPWLVLEPTIWVDRHEGEPRARNPEAADFIRERLARRYYANWNDLLDAWVTILVGTERQMTLRAFGTNDGVDAVFQLTNVTGFSRP